MSFQDLDFKSDRIYPARSGNLLPMPSSFRFNLIIKLLMAATVVTLLGFSVSNWQPSAKSADSTPNPDRLHYSLPLPAPDTALQDEIAEVVEQIEPSQWESVIIKSGDTLASIFASKGISSTTTHKVATLNEQTRKLRYIQPGDEIRLLLDEQRKLRQMKYIEDITRTLLIQRNEEQAFTSQIINYQLDAFPVYREGVIDSSLFEAAANADIPEDVIMDLVAIFGWDIDFSLDIRSGDRFGIVYEELFKDDVKIRNGRILSAEFINDGKTYRATYYKDPTGDSDYYAPDGRSMRKAFLRSPVKFSRISSRFSNKRWHPVLSKWRSHKGVDYAAPTGTPIKATARGRVTFVGTKGGYGKLIVLKHDNKYDTAYGHLSKFTKGLRNGKRIEQGDIIGYVGATGLATGPHLHYELRVNGAQRDPATIVLPDAPPIATKNMPTFYKETKPLVARLNVLRNQTHLALK
jgi:murein DD-endopeptidase MepM/ murein hydrolase activator NlpD